MTTVDDCKIVYFNKTHSDMGNLVVVQGNKDIPFDIRRVYYINDVPDGGERGSHAHRELTQLIIAANGQFDIRIDDGRRKRAITLTNNGSLGHGLLVVPGIWRELIRFSLDAVCLVLASKDYDESDYMRNYDEFLKFKS